LSLWAKIKRRRIFQVVVAYAVLAWLLVQVIVNVEAPLNLPNWADTLVITLLAIGLPVALLLAWFFEPKLAHDHSLAGAEQPESAASSPGAKSRPRRGEIRFCTTPGGHRLAYSRVGSGPALVRTGNWLSHQELDWEVPMMSSLLRDLPRTFDLLTYDGRGTGLSDRGVSEFSLETMVEDLEVVADTNKLDKFAILALSQSCAVSIAYAVKHPHRVSHMVFYGGFTHNFRTQEEIDAMATLFSQNWGRANPGTRQIFTSALFPDATKEEADAFNEWQKHSSSPDTAARLFRAVHRIDVREQAKRVSVPTLVMHSKDEAGVPLEYAREMAALIPGARLVILSSRNHIVLEREPAYKQFLDETVSFIRAS
jgi:pimeloyl-ACP methyl ester carboxylesterase